MLQGHTGAQAVVLDTYMMQFTIINAELIVAVWRIYASVN